jgi:hypothetical protein
MAIVVDHGQVVLERIAVREAERAALEAKIAEDMLEFQDIRRAQAESAENKTLRDIEVSFAADELAVALHQPVRVVQCRLVEARRVRNVLPLTWSAFKRGEIDAYRISIVAAAADKMADNHSLIHLDATVAHDAPTRTAPQLKAALKRFVARWEPDQGAARARTEQAKRSVWVDHQDDGMSYLHAYLPTPDAVRIDAELTERAKQVPSDDRTLDQKRADGFVAQMLRHVEGQSRSSRAVIGITVPLTSLAGLADEPGESFDGSFALPAAMVRDLAAEPGTLFFRIMTDPLGKILDVTELGRFPSDKLRIAVHVRDGTCRFATCTRPAMESDIDHKIPHPRGPTRGANLRGLCRRHHNFKTYNIAEPTALVMRAHTKSHAESDFAHWLTGINYAA